MENLYVVFCEPEGSLKVHHLIVKADSEKEALKALIDQNPQAACPLSEYGDWPDKNGDFIEVIEK